MVVDTAHSVAELSSAEDSPLDTAVLPLDTAVSLQVTAHSALDTVQVTVPDTDMVPVTVLVTDQDLD